MAVAGREGQRASVRRPELRAFGALAALVTGGPYAAADVLKRLCTEVRSSFGFGRAAVLRHDAAAGTVAPVVRQGLDWGDAAIALADVPVVAGALARGEAVAAPGAGAGL